MSPFEQMLPKMTDDETHGQTVVYLRPKGENTQNGFMSWLETVLVQTGHAGADQIRRQVAMQDEAKGTGAFDAESGFIRTPSGRRNIGSREAVTTAPQRNRLEQGLQTIAKRLAPLAARLGSIHRREASVESAFPLAQE